MFRAESPQACVRWASSRHAHDEIVELGVRSLAALSLKLADRPYIMGRTPCGLDATAFANARRDLHAVLRFARCSGGLKASAICLPTPTG